MAASCFSVWAVRAARNVRLLRPRVRPRGQIPTAALRWRSTSTPPSSAAERSSAVAINERSTRAQKPPTPRRLPPDTSRRGGDDEYRWMHDTGSEEMLRHMEHENRYSAACLKPLRRRASALFRRMVDRQPEEEGGARRSVPERLGGYLYYTRRDDGKGFPVYVRRPVEGTLHDEQVVFDLNEIEEHGLRTGSGGHGGDHGGGGAKGDPDHVPPTPALGSMKLSPDQRMLACTIGVDGSDRFVLAVFDLLGGLGGEGRSGSGNAHRGPTAAVLSEDAIWDDVVGVEWGSSWPPTSRGGGGGGRGDPEVSKYELYYTVPDELRRPWQVRRATLHRRTRTGYSGGGGEEPEGGDAGGGGWRVDSAGDRTVFEEKNDAFFVDVGRTKDHSFVVINVHSKTTSEVYLIPTATGTAGASDAGGGRVDVGQGTTAAKGDSDEERSVVNGGNSDGAAPRGHHHHRAGPALLLRRRQQGVEYYVDHAGDAFYIVTNSPPSGAGDGQNEAATGVGEYRLVRVRQPPGRRRGSASSLEGVADAPWEALPCGGDGCTIQEMDLFRSHCVLYESSALSGCPRLRVVPLAASDGTRPGSSPFAVSPPAAGGCSGGGGNTGASSDGESSTNISSESSRDCDFKGRGGVATPSACTLRPGVNSWFEARTARFSLSSPVAPEDVYDLCLESGRMDLLRRTEVPGSPPFDGRDYSCYTVQVASHDEEMVPLTIVHRRDTQVDGSNRLVLHGYGSYGMSLPIDYHPEHACMLERGWVLAFAHVRGGGERGKAWHAAGRGPNKWNSFWDFQACADHLIAEGFTSPSALGAHVNSAGGLLAGAMANFRPGLFSAMVMKAPFLGVLSAMRDTSLPLTVHEFDEWGDPNSSEEVEAMIRSYCPYENVREQEYPALLVTASVNDNRVNVWDPAKWVSRVRAANTGDAPVLLRVSDTDGHHGPDNTLDGLRDSAMEMSFLEKYLRVQAKNGASSATPAQQYK